MKSADFAMTIQNRGNAVYRVSPRRPILNSLREQGVDLPYGCRYGGCITCAAKLIRGKVDQRAQTALNNRQLKAGYVILCVARPLSDCIFEIGVESHDQLYRCLLYTSPSPRDKRQSRMPSSA